MLGALEIDTNATGVDLRGHETTTKAFQELYGEDVLPEELIAFFNNGLGELSCARDLGTSMSAVCGDAIKLIAKWIL